MTSRQAGIGVFAMALALATSVACGKVGPPRRTKPAPPATAQEVQAEPEEEEQP